MKRFSVLFLISLLLIETNIGNFFSQAIETGLISRDDYNNLGGSAESQFSRKASSWRTAALFQTVNEVDVATIYGNRTDLEISKAINSIGSINATLLLAPGSWKINNSITIPSNVGVRIPNGGLLNVNSSVTLSINGPFEAGIYPIFLGTGKTPVTFGDRSVETVYPQWFGVVAGQDNTTKWHQAINSLPAGGTLRIPTGTYTIDNSVGKLSGTLPSGLGGYGLRLKSKMKILLDPGATLAVKSSSINVFAPLLLLLDVTDVEISGGALLGNRDSYSEVGEWSYGIGVYGSSRIRIRDISIGNQVGDGIALSAGVTNNLSSDVLIENAYIYSNRRQGISLIGCHDVRISKCEIYDSGNGYASGTTMAIDIEPDDNANRIPQSVYDVLIEKCNIHDNGEGIYIQALGTRCNVWGISIRDNYITGCTRTGAGQYAVLLNRANGIYYDISIDGNKIISNKGGGIGIAQASGRVIITNNFIYDSQDTSLGDGIALYNTSGTGKVTVTGNTILNSGRCGIYIVGNDNLISNNTVENSKQHGIVTATGPCARNLILGNRIAGNGTSKDDTYSNIRIANILGTNNNIVSGNIIRKGSARNPAKYGIEIEGAGAANNLISNNDVTDGGKTANIYDAGTTSIIRGNVGYNPKGILGPPSIPKSGNVLANPYNVDCTVHITGGTVLAIAIGGRPTGLTSGSFRVPAGQTIALTYTAAPTWTWFGD